MATAQKLQAMKNDLLNRTRLIGVNPEVSERVIEAIGVTESQNPGYIGRVVSGKRSDAEQLVDFLKGRDPVTHKIINKDDVVTYAETADDSAHGSGNAADVEWLDLTGKIAKDSDPIWKKWGANVKAAGLDWGGDFENILDMPHAQLKQWRKHRNWASEPKINALASASKPEPKGEFAGGYGWLVGLLVVGGLAYTAYKAKS